VNEVTRHKRPGECTPEERREFERLVREGFRPVREPLDRRIADAECLAFHYDDVAGLVAIAALKVPTPEYRSYVFHRAAAPSSAADYPLELGWVYVKPRFRGRGIASHLCGSLYRRAAGSGLFATTRPDNHSMIRILNTLGFSSVGRPYPRRNEVMSLFLRSLVAQ